MYNYKLYRRYLNMMDINTAAFLNGYSVITVVDLINRKVVEGKTYRIGKNVFGEVDEVALKAYKESATSRKLSARDKGKAAVSKSFNYLRAREQYRKEVI
jgi:hypothetical protein